MRTQWDQTCDGYPAAIIDLLNNGKLDGVDLHNYLGYWSNVDSFRKSPQGSFDAVKSHLRSNGLTKDISYYCTEFGSHTIGSGGAI